MQEGWEGMKERDRRACGQVEEGQRERGRREGQDLDGSDLVRLRHKATRPQSKQMLLSHPWKRIVKWALTPPLKTRSSSSLHKSDRWMGRTLVFSCFHPPRVSLLLSSSPHSFVHGN